MDTNGNGFVSGFLRHCSDDKHFLTPKNTCKNKGEFFLQLENLEVLLAIAENGSSRKAADALCTSFQNVSRVLKQAEEEWGVRLFTRGSKGMTPTPEGDLAIMTAREMLALYEQMLDQFSYRKEDADAKPDKKISGKLALTSSTMVNNAFLNDVLLEFSMQYPRINVILSEEDAYLVKSAHDANISLAPRINSEDPISGPGIIPLLKDHVVLLVKNGSDFDQQRSISLKRVAELPLVLVANSRWEETIFGHILHANKLDPQNATFTSSIIGFQKYLATGQYAGLSTDIISRKMLSDKRLDLKIVSIRNRSVEITYCMAIQNRDSLTDVERCFIDFMKDNFHIETPEH